MIIALLGNIGSGKSVSMTKKIVDNNKPCFVNFNLKHPNAKRIKKEHIVTSNVVRVKKNGEPVLEHKVNWDFWNKARKELGDFHIAIDELHNLAHSRQSITKWNTLFSIWISQIRKLLGSSETTHIYLVSQRLGRIDVAFRDLIHIIIACYKQETKQVLRTVVNNKRKKEVKLLPVTWVYHYYFTGDNCVEKYQAFKYNREKTYDGRTGFIANPYFQFYDSYEVFGETAYL